MIIEEMKTNHEETNMKKKIVAILLTATVLLTMAGCGNEGESKETETSSEIQESTVESIPEETTIEETIVETTESEVASEVGSLEEMVTSIYENIKMELALGPVTQVALDTPDQVKFMLGLDSADGIVEAVTSEPMMSSVAYSLALVKVEEGADIEAIKTAIHENVDARKWICVEAEKVIATSSDDIVLLIMTEPALADSIIESFTEVAGATLGETLIRTSTTQ